MRGMKDFLDHVGACRIVQDHTGSHRIMQDHAGSCKNMKVKQECMFGMFCHLYIGAVNLVVNCDNFSQLRTTCVVF